MLKNKFSRPNLLNWTVLFCHLQDCSRQFFYIFNSWKLNQWKPSKLNYLLHCVVAERYHHWRFLQSYGWCRRNSWGSKIAWGRGWWWTEEEIREWRYFISEYIFIYNFLLTGMQVGPTYPFCTGAIFSLFPKTVLISLLLECLAVILDKNTSNGWLFPDF